MEKSPAARVDDATYGGFSKEVTVPSEAAIVNVNLSPDWSVPVATAVEETQRITLAGCPAENSAGVMPKATVSLCCARTLGAGMKSDSRASDNRNGNNARFVRMGLFAKCASLSVN